MVLAVDIGNTNIHVGLFDKGEGGSPRAVFCLGTDERRSADEYALLFSALSERNGVPASEISEVIVGSVVPTLTGKVQSALKALSGAPVTVVGPGVKTGFSIRLPDPSELGADLCANAAGAIATVGVPCVTVDLGTATVVSAVTADKVFPGASILPGVQMSFGALDETGMLKQVSPGAPTAIGRNTEEAIRSGVLYGQSYAITGLVRQYIRTLGLPENAPVVVTGGYAEGLLPMLPASYRYVPMLTLRGLYEIALLNGRKK